MFDGILNEVKERGETIQVEVESDQLIPSVRENKDGTRDFMLQFVDGTEYPCLAKGWMSWADKILNPDDHTRDAHELINRETGRRSRWSTASIRKFLEMTPAKVADAAVKAWWEKHKSEPWSVIKYKDNGHPGPIRYIGTRRYRLYRHEEFIADLTNGIRPEGFVLKNANLSEDYLILRVTDHNNIKLPGYNGKNLFSGFHIMNSENGSSSIMIKYLIYDLVCTNGLMILIDEKKIISQRHSKFDVSTFRDSIVEASKKLSEYQSKSTSLISKLLEFRPSAREVAAMMTLYREQYNVSDKFIEDVENHFRENPGDTSWHLISSITRRAQDYGWDNRMQQEENAGDFVHRVISGDYRKYIEAEATT